jgi:hypothetical protein
MKDSVTCRVPNRHRRARSSRKIVNGPPLACELGQDDRKRATLGAGRKTCRRASGYGGASSAGSMARVSVFFGGIAATGEVIMCDGAAQLRGRGAVTPCRIKILGRYEANVRGFTWRRASRTCCSPPRWVTNEASGRCEYRGWMNRPDAPVESSIPLSGIPFDGC